jgi:hypothetical protein
VNKQRFCSPSYQLRSPGVIGTVVELEMPDYEFRFFRQGTLKAIHVTAMDSDSEACARARVYLEKTPSFEHVEVRSGLRFMQKVLPEKSEPVIG